MQPGRQTFNRGIEVMRLLAERGPQTASAIAAAMGLAQSSASRLLQSLIAAGFVCKPSYREFALDYGLLAFAGVAMQRLPLVGRAADVGSRLGHEHACGVAITMLLQDRQLYLARRHPRMDASLLLIDDAGWPLHRSSPGLLLAFRQGPEAFARLIGESLRQQGDPPETVTQLHDMVAASLREHGILYLPHWEDSALHAVSSTTIDGRDVALAVLTYERTWTAAEAAAVLQQGLRELAP